MKNTTNLPIFKIFPDHCSSGLWMVAPGEDYHTSCDLDDLPLNLHRRIVKKIDLMNQSYELFSDAGHHPHPTIVEEESFDFMVFDIYQDIRKTHPEFAHCFVPHETYEHMFAQHEKDVLESQINSTLAISHKKVI